MLIAEPSTNTAHQREKYALMLSVCFVSITILMRQNNTSGFLATFVVMTLSYIPVLLQGPETPFLIC